MRRAGDPPRSPRVLLELAVGVLAAHPALGADASSPRLFPIDDIFEIEGSGMFYGGP